MGTRPIRAADWRWVWRDQQSSHALVPRHAATVTSSSVTALLAIIFIALGNVTVAHGQGWSADVSAGRLVYDPVSANLTTNNLIGSLRYDAGRETWVYGAAAVPAGDEGPFWGAVGGGGRLTFF